MLVNVVFADCIVKTGDCMFKLGHPSIELSQLKAILQNKITDSAKSGAHTQDGRHK